MRLINSLFLWIILFGLSACSEGPDTSFQIAQQGLISGAISDDGKAAVAGSIHHGGSYWDLTRKERLYNWNHQNGEMSLLRAVALSKDGSIAVTCQEDTLVVWDTRSGKSTQFWQAEDRVHAISLNASGDRALIGLRNGNVSFFNLRTGETLFRFKHQAEVRSTMLSADGKTGLSAGDDKVVKVLDLVAGKELHQKTLRNQIKTIALSNSGKLAFATAQREDALMWNVNTNDVIFTKDNRVTNFTSADFSDDERFLSLGTFSGAIIKLDATTGKQLNKWQAAPRQAYGGASSKAIISLSDTGQKVFALTSDGMFQTF